MLENSCGEPEWWQHSDYNATEQRVDPLQNELDALRSEVMRWKVGEQQRLLKDLDEAWFREQHPSVQDAWDQYQTVMRLARSE